MPLGEPIPTQSHYGTTFHSCLQAHLLTLHILEDTKSRQELQSLPRPITWILYSVVQPYDIECEDACKQHLSVFSQDFTPANKSIPQTLHWHQLHMGWPRMWGKVLSDHMPSLPTSAITGGSFAEWRSARAYSTQIKRSLCSNQQLHSKRIIIPAIGCEVLLHSR